jgi:hypothetical protein
MDHGNAIRILSALAQGTDPARGVPIAADTVWQQPDVVRALFHALSHLGLPPRADSTTVAPPRTPTGNAGRPWSAAETEQVAAAFDTGQPVDAIAADLGRSKLAVEIRLAHLGRLPMPANTRYGTPKSAASVPTAPADAASVDSPAEQAAPAVSVRSRRARQAEQPAARYGTALLRRAA